MNESKKLNTRQSLAADLRALGLGAGDVVLVHTSLSKVGYTVGGPISMIGALTDAVGDGGTVVMPAFTANGYSNPLDWKSPPVSKERAEIIRASLPPFDPATTPCREMGVVPDLFRTLPGVQRSNHPVVSYAARGRHAEQILANQPMGMMDGPDSPLGRIYELGGKELLVGVGYGNCTSIHMGTHRMPDPIYVDIELPEWDEDGHVAWVAHRDVLQPDERWGDIVSEDRPFEEIGAAFEAGVGASVGMIGNAESRLMSQRAIVDFAGEWFTAHPYGVRPYEGPLD